MKRTNMKYLLLKLIDHLRQGCYFQFAIDSQKLDFSVLGKVNHLLSVKHLQRDVQSLKLINNLLGFEKDFLYLQRLFSKLLHIRSGYENTAQILLGQEANQIYGFSSVTPGRVQGKPIQRARTAERNRTQMPLDPYATTQASSVENPDTFNHTRNSALVKGSGSYNSDDLN